MKDLPRFFLQGTIILEEFSAEIDRSEWFSQDDVDNKRVYLQNLIQKLKKREAEESEN